MGVHGYNIDLNKIHFLLFFWLNDITTTTVSDSGYAREYSWYGLPYHHKRNSTVFYHIGFKIPSRHVKKNTLFE